MEFFNSAIEVLQTLVVALGAGLGDRGGEHDLSLACGRRCDGLSLLLYRQIAV